MADAITLDGADDFFEFKLQRMYSAEMRSLDMLEEAAAEAQEPRLKEAFEHHHEETTKQMTRLEGVFSSLGRKPRVVDASVVEGLVEEKRRFVAEEPTPELLDAFNLGAAVTNEHVEIAAYEHLLTLAERLALGDVVEPLRANLEEERTALEKLTDLAKQGPPAPKARPEMSH